VEADNLHGLGRSIPRNLLKNTSERVLGQLVSWHLRGAIPSMNVLRRDKQAVLIQLLSVSFKWLHTEAKRYQVELTYLLLGMSRLLVESLNEV
jgi:hypothetical protein